MNKNYVKLFRYYLSRFSVIFMVFAYGFWFLAELLAVLIAIRTNPDVQIVEGIVLFTLPVLPAMITGVLMTIIKTNRNYKMYSEFCKNQSFDISAVIQAVVGYQFDAFVTNTELARMSREDFVRWSSTNAREIYTSYFSDF